MDALLLYKQLVSVGAKQSHIKLRNLSSYSDSNWFKIKCYCKIVENVSRPYEVINIKINKKHADTMNAMAEN